MEKPIVAITDKLSIQSLDLSSNEIRFMPEQNDSMLQAISNSYIQELDLSHNLIGD